MPAKKESITAFEEDLMIVEEYLDIRNVHWAAPACMITSPWDGPVLN